MDDRLIENLAVGFADVLSKYAKAHRAHPLLGCESPIEKALALAINLDHQLWFGRPLVIDAAGLTEDQCKAIADQGQDGIFPQVLIGNYRVDFFAVHPVGLSGVGGFVIECDGHDFHERTKKQAARDRSRDRTLLAMGYPVIRFTGSEIWADPIKCARHVIHEVMDRTGSALILRDRPTDRVDPDVVQISGGP